MDDDSVVEQVRTARESYARSHNFDLHAIVADLRRQDDRGDWPVVRLEPRRVQIVGNVPSPTEISGPIGSFPAIEKPGTQ